MRLATQNNLGNALLTLGERESGTARLEEAIATWEEQPLSRATKTLRKRSGGAADFADVGRAVGGPSTVRATDSTSTACTLRSAALYDRLEFFFLGGDVLLPHYCVVADPVLSKDYAARKI